MLTWYITVALVLAGLPWDTAVIASTASASEPPLVSQRFDSTQPCPRAPNDRRLPSGVGCLTVLNGDLDSDGTSDQYALFAYLDDSGNAQRWAVEAILSNGSILPRDLDQSDPNLYAGPSLLSAHDLDRDGRAEVFVQVGHISTYDIAQIFTLKDALSPVMQERGSGIYFGGADGDSTWGYACESHENGPDTFHEYSAISDSTFSHWKWTDTRFHLTGTTLMFDDEKKGSFDGNKQSVTRKLSAVGRPCILADARRTSPSAKDSDGDGLSDAIESEDWPQREAVFCGGSPRMCEYPSLTMKDIYVEIDWMAVHVSSGNSKHHNDHRLSPDTLEAVTDIFLKHDVRIHFDQGELGGGNELEHLDVVSWSHTRRLYYEQRFANVRHGVFHYAIMAHESEDGSAGRGQAPGDMLILFRNTIDGEAEKSACGVTRVVKCSLTAKDDFVIDAFLNELGHNLFDEITPLDDSYCTTARAARKECSFDPFHDNASRHAMWPYLNGRRDYHDRRWKNDLPEMAQWNS